MGILPLRARTAALYSRRIRASLRFARLSGAKVFTEDGPAKEVVRLRPASGDFEQIANNKRTHMKITNTLNIVAGLAFFALVPLRRARDDFAPN